MKTWWPLFRRFVRIEAVLALIFAAAMLVGFVVSTALDRQGFGERAESFGFLELRLRDDVDVEALTSELEPFAGSLALFRRDGSRWVRFEQIEDDRALKRAVEPSVDVGHPGGDRRLGTDIFDFSIASLTTRLSILVMLIVQFALFGLVGWRLGRRFRPEPRLRARPWLVGVGAAGVALVSGLLLSALMRAIGFPIAEQEIVVETLRGPAWPIGLFFVVLVAPLTEELLFRGWALNALREVGPDWVAIALSAAIFAGVHFNPPALPIYLLYGAILGWIYLRSGSLVAPIVAHLLINAFGAATIVFG